MSTLRFNSDELPANARVVGMRGREAISEPYALEVFLVLAASDCASLDFDAVIGTRANLELSASDQDEASDAVRTCGVVDAFELLHAQDDHVLVGVSLVPALQHLTLGEHSRMFTDMPVGDIIQKVIDDAELDSELNLQVSGEHPDEEHVCQYRESDHAFLARWMEREGIRYFFDHSGEVEKLVITDAALAHDPCLETPVRYHPVDGGDITSGEALNSWRATSRRLPASVKLHDYDHLSPSLDVMGEAQVSDLGSAEVVHHEMRFFTPDDGGRLATLRSEEQLARELVFEGHGTIVGLRPGFRFELEGHPSGELNQPYLVVAVEHEAAQMLGDGVFRELTGIHLTEGYQVKVTAIPTSVAYRPPSRSPWPSIRGYVLARVDGEIDSDYAQLDEHGRYQIKLFCDESDLENGSASTRLRMLQPHAGSPEGWHFPLRKGTEVVVAFVGGDPDRPVIAAAVPNAETPSVVTSANNTQNVLQTGGLTRIEIEDQEGEQYFYDYTPPEDSYLHLGYPFENPPTHNVVLHTKGDNLFDIGSNQDITVGGVLDEQVTKEVKETYRAKQTSTIEGKKDTEVGGAVKEHYYATQTTTVNGGLTQEINHNGQSTLLTGARTETYNNGLNTQGFGGTYEFYKAAYTRNVTGATFEDHQGTLFESADGPVSEEFPASMEETYGDCTWIWDSLHWTTSKIERHGDKLHIHAPHMAEFEGTDWHCDWMLTAEHSSEHKVLITWLDRIGALIGMFTIKTDLVVANHQLMGLHGHAITAEVKAGALVAKVLGISKK